MGGVQSGIGTEYMPNTSLDRYQYTHLLSRKTLQDGDYWRAHASMVIMTFACDG
jgi:hypothetical protein